MFGFIKNLMKQETHKLERETNSNLIESVCNCYISSLEYNTPLNVDTFCKELRMTEEEIASVHKLIKERQIKMKMDKLQEDF